MAPRKSSPIKAQSAADAEGTKPPRTRNRTRTQRAGLLGRQPPRNLSNPLGDADFHSPYARKSYKRRAARQITFAKSPLMPQRPHAEGWHLERCCRQGKHTTRRRGRTLASTRGIGPRRAPVSPISRIQQPQDPLHERTTTVHSATAKTGAVTSTEETTIDRQLHRENCE